MSKKQDKIEEKVKKKWKKKKTVVKNMDLSIYVGYGRKFSYSMMRVDHFS